MHVTGSSEDGYVEALDRYWGDRDFPDAVILSTGQFRQIIELWGMADSVNFDSIGTGYNGYLLGISVWVDDRFEQPIFIASTE